MTPSNYLITQREQQFRAVDMYERGRSFILACGLVKAHEGHSFVYLYLLCQGFENIGKALLLAKNYEFYWNKLNKSPFGHNLVTTMTEVLNQYGENFLTKEAQVELREVNIYYNNHILRYGGFTEKFKDAQLVQADRLHISIVEKLVHLNNIFSFGTVC